MCTGIRLLLLIRPFISSFFVLFILQTLKFFVTLFSGTVRPRRLKLGTHVDSGQMYRVYRNKNAAAYSFLYFSFFFLSGFQTLTFFVTPFSGTVRLRRLKLVTYVAISGCIVCTGIMLLFLLVPLFLHVSFSQIFKLNKFFVTLCSGTVGPRRLKLSTHVDSGQVYRVYQNQAAAAYPSLYFVIFLSLQFSSIKIVVTHI